MYTQAQINRWKNLIKEGCKLADEAKAEVKEIKADLDKSEQRLARINSSIKRLEETLELMEIKNG